MQLCTFRARRLRGRTALAVLAVLLPAAGCNNDSSASDDDDASADDDDGALLPTGEEDPGWRVTPAQLDMDLFETAQLNFSGEAPVDAVTGYSIKIRQPFEGINFFNAAPGVYLPEDTTIRDFHVSGEETFAVSIQVECLAASSTNVEFRLNSNSPSETIEVPITCGGGNASTASTSTTGETTDMGTSGVTTDFESESESTTGPTAEFDLLCRWVYGETLQAVTIDGADAGTEDVEPGFYIGSWDTDPSDGAVIASSTAEAGPVGFGRWASAEDLLSGEPMTFIDDDAGSAGARACATSAGGVFAVSGADAKFCDFAAGTCTSLGLDNPMLECVCDGMECFASESTQLGYLHSIDGGQSFTLVMDNVAPGSLRSNSAGAIMFRDGPLGAVMYGSSFGGPFSVSSLPANSDERLGPNFLGDGVAFLTDLGGGTSMTLRSDDDGQTFVEVTPPSEFALFQMTQLADGRILAPDSQFNVWLSTDTTATDWEARDDLQLLFPNNCLAVGR